MLKEYLKNILNLSTRLTIRLKNSDCLLVNDKAVTPRYILQTNDTVKLIINDINEPILATKGSFPIEILYKDDYIVVVNKPPYMPVHPSIANYDKTLINYLAYELGINSVHICTRLDHNTSGIVLLALDSYTCERLNNQLLNNAIVKKYLAVCNGNIYEKGEIILPIDRAADSSILRKVSENGQYAKTIYKPLRSLDCGTLVEIELFTGRTHQIRVHMAHIGHSILGDDLYGTASNLIDRQALHCSSISFCHPHTSEQLTINCPLPDDIINIL